MSDSPSDIAEALSAAFQHHQAGRCSEAQAIYRQILAVSPDVADAHYNLGVLLAQQGQHEQAVESYRKTIELLPRNDQAHYSLGNALRILGQFDQAISAYRQAIELRPDHAQAHNNLANLLKDAGKLDEAIAHYRKTLQLRPDFNTAESALLFTMNSHPRLSPDEIFIAHRQWYEHHVAGLSGRAGPHGNSPDPERRLQIGYVSGDFRDHPVASFITPVLRSHDRQNFEIFCYNTATAPPSEFDCHWRDVASLSDQQLADLIRQDEIDILVDLSGHTAHNRLLVFARKPAPVQITYLGYPNTTGLDEIDYRLTDAWADPPGMTERFYSERLLHLPGAFFCYAADERAGHVTPLPASPKGHVTFASLNRFSKVTPQVLQCWARILAAVPDSHLVMVVPASQQLADELAAFFEGAGISPQRLQLLHRQPIHEYYKMYQRVDIALDTFPFAGHTTTCDCLWMGVPVVTLGGKTAVSRAGVSVLGNLKLEQLIADTPQGYEEIAMRLAADLGRLAQLRRELRPRMAASILTDARRFTRSLEGTYRNVWRAWCDARSQTGRSAGPDADAHYRLGNALRLSGRPDEAISAYQQAIALRPGHAESLNNLANLLKDAGRLDEAIACFQRAAELRPRSAEIYDNLGAALGQQGRLDEAVACLKHAAALGPDFPQTHNNLGNALKQQGQLEQAIACYQRAVSLKPDFAEAHYNLGVALRENGQVDQAIACQRSALAIKPDFAAAYYDLASALRDKGQVEEARDCLEKALTLKPDFAEAQNNLGSLLHDLGGTAEAIALYRRSLAAKPDFYEAHSNLANALTELGQLDEAIASCKRALSLKPEYALAHWNYAAPLLMRGDFAQGWREYEWRWKCKELAPLSCLGVGGPRWDGSSLEGRTILLHAEQGLGDSIQFVRYAPLVAGKDGKVILAVQPSLARLLRSVEDVTEVIPFDQPIPSVQVHCPLLSLPLVFGTTLQTIPADVPYLKPPEAAAAAWKKRLKGDQRRLKVGLAWAGSATHKNDRNRSIRLADLAPLACAPDVRFYSLQKGAGANQVSQAPAEMELIDWTDELSDFADTAALIANLDLVISVDTAVAHLAGAIGKPVWTLLPFVAEWRWLLDRQDSPWYPTMRLFRQNRPGDWAGVVMQVMQALEKLRCHKTKS